MHKKQRMKRSIVLVVSAAFLLMYSCDNEKPKPSSNNQSQELCDSIAITYDGHIKAIVDASCNTSTCHALSAGGFKLGTFAEVKTAAEKANFLGAIKHENGFEAMPRNQPKLGDDIIQQFECWEKTNFPQN